MDQENTHTTWKIDHSCEKKTSNAMHSPPPKEREGIAYKIILKRPFCKKEKKIKMYRYLEQKLSNLCHILQ